MDSSDSFRVLTSMIAPAVLISAAGILALSTSTRLTRVVDRVRALGNRAHDTRLMQNPREKEMILDQLTRLSRRMGLLRNALTSLYLAISIFVATSICLGLVSALQWHYEWITVVMAMLGTMALLFSSILLISEGRHAVASSFMEMQFLRESIESGDRLPQ